MMQHTYLIVCEDCGAPPISRENIGGCRCWRCPDCALAAERADLVEYFGSRYVLLDGRHWIDGVAIGYGDALALLGAAREQEEGVAA